MRVFMFILLILGIIYVVGLVYYCICVSIQFYAGYLDKKSTISQFKAMTIWPIISIWCYIENRKNN